MNDMREMSIWMIGCSLFFIIGLGGVIVCGMFGFAKTLGYAITCGILGGLCGLNACLIKAVKREKLVILQTELNDNKPNRNKNLVLGYCRRFENTSYRMAIPACIKHIVVDYIRNDDNM